MNSRWVRRLAVAVSLVTLTTAYGLAGEHALIEQRMCLGMASPESVDPGFAYPVTETASPQPVDPGFFYPVMQGPSPEAVDPGFVPPQVCSDDTAPTSTSRIASPDASPEPRRS
jgi:hypothetical protein